MGQKVDVSACVPLVTGGEADLGAARDFLAAVPDGAQVTFGSPDMLGDRSVCASWTEERSSTDLGSAEDGCGCS